LRRVLCFIVTISTTFGICKPAQAQSAVNVSDVRVDYSFGKEITFCGLFPQDALGALLAYAESAPFSRYLHETYGTSVLLNLILANRDGIDCEQGAARLRSKA
jgi:hypothetical protein